MKSTHQRDNYMSMFIPTLFIIAKIWSQFISINYTHTHTHAYTHTHTHTHIQPKKNEILSFGENW
jgi:hypothetical protein